MFLHLGVITFAQDDNSSGNIESPKTEDNNTLIDNTTDNTTDTSNETPSVNPPDAETTTTDPGKSDDDWGSADSTWGDSSFENSTDTNKKDLKVFLENDNYFNTAPDESFNTAYKKCEIRANVDFATSIDNLSFKLVTDAYFTPRLLSDNIYSAHTYSESFRVMRNGSISGESYELNPRQAYVGYEDGKYRIRAGNQLFNWGTADVFNPTSYFNPFDMREYLLKDDDEMKYGVPAISGLYTIGATSLEAVITPVHIPLTFANKNAFWELKYNEGPFPVNIEQPSSLPLSFYNCGIGLQYYFNYFKTDFYISVYHGPDDEPLMRPIGTKITPNEPLSIIISPEYKTVDMTGLAFSKSVSRFVIQAEGVYSFNKYGVIEQDYTTDLKFPLSIDKSHFISYSTGINYFIPLNDIIPGHQGTSVATLEWMQSIYFDDRMMAPLLTKIIIARMQDTIMDEKLDIIFTTIYDTQNSSIIVMPETGYKINSNLSLKVSYSFIKSDPDSFMGYYNDNDILSWRLRYEF